MSEPRQGRIEYSRHAIAVADARDLATVLALIAGLPDVVAVNIVDVEGGPPVALSEQSLLNALASQPGAITVEALPRSMYLRIMRDKIELAVREALALRTILCSCAIGDVPTEAGTVLRHLDQILFLLRSYALQDGGAILPKTIDALASRRAQLAESCFESGDNVRCMDDLHYEVVPVLAELFKLFA